MHAHHSPHHFAYVVPDIEKAVDHWSRLLGAGPFFMIDPIKYDRVTHHGKPCVFDHSAAFGQWGSVFIEFQQIHATAPESLTTLVVRGPHPIINHVAYVTPTPERDSAALSAEGYPLFLEATFGEVEIRFHDTQNALGQAIEIHRQCKFLETLFGDIAGAAKGWDGKQALRRWE